jgi:hypothetical protein
VTAHDAPRPENDQRQVSGYGIEQAWGLNIFSFLVPSKGELALDRACFKNKVNMYIRLKNNLGPRLPKCERPAAKKNQPAKEWRKFFSKA